MDRSNLVGKLPAEVIGPVAFLVVVEMMAITSAFAMNKLGTDDHPLYKWLVWLIPLPPPVAFYIMISYYAAQTVSRWWALLFP